MSGSGISWAICKSAPRSRQITMPAPHLSVFLQAGCPSCRPTNSVKALKASFNTKDYVTVPGRHESTRTKCPVAVECDEIAHVLCDFWERQPYQAVTWYHYITSMLKFLWYNFWILSCLQFSLVQGSATLWTVCLCCRCLSACRMEDITV